MDEFASTDQPPVVTNTCESDADCASSTYSGTCGPGMCLASSGDIQAGFIEVVPPAVALFGAGDSFLIAVDNLKHNRSDLELQLPEYANVTGLITVEPSVLGDPPSESCENAFDAPSRTLRAHVELSRSDAIHGLPSLSVAANAELGSAGWEFEGDVPAGRYDIYATVLSGCGADFPPLLTRGKMLAGGDVTLALHVGALTKLSGIVTPPATQTGHVSLAGWTVSLVEPRGGRLISTTRKLNDSNPTNFELRYQPLSEESPLLRLVPPEDLVAPEVIWDLSVLDLDGDGQLSPDLEALDLATVSVQARIVDVELAPVGKASVRLRSTRLLSAAQGLSARYETQVTSDADGKVTVELLPGTYQVIVTPPDQTELALTEATWEIARTPAEQAGRTVEVAPRPLLRGSVEDPVSGLPLGGVSVGVVPSSSPKSLFLDRLLKPIPVLPRVASGFTSDDGSFAVPVDPGLVDVSVKPSEATSFPWLIRSRVEVPGPTLGSMPVTFPVLLSGKVIDPTAFPVQRALLRVFTVLDDDAPSGLARSNDLTSGDGTLQVAEGRTDENGNFVLLLPSAVQPAGQPAVQPAVQPAGQPAG